MNRRILTIAAGVRVIGPAAVNCTECGKPARLVGGGELYPHRPDLSHVKAWVCACGARVGCHDGTEKPKGTFATPAVIKARQAAHRVFDPLWEKFIEAYPPGERPRSSRAKLRRTARNRAYWWLSNQMGSPNKQVHIGEMDEVQAAQVVVIIALEKPTPRSIREWSKARVEVQS